jgi:hypothetical protein
MSAADDASVAISCLGRRLTAFAIGEPSTSKVERFATGEDLPSIQQEIRLFGLAKWIGIMRDKEADPTIRALSIGQWPELNDQAPIELFHIGQGWRALIAAKSYQ